MRGTHGGLIKNEHGDKNTEEHEMQPAAVDYGSGKMHGHFDSKYLEFTKHALNTKFAIQTTHETNGLHEHSVSRKGR